MCADRRIAIVGSRNYPRPDLVVAYVGQLPRNATVVSGGARGVDTVATDAAAARGLEVVVFKADWTSHGSKAGPMRNQSIVANTDRVVAFWDGTSRGTLNTLVLASLAGLPIEIRGPDGAPVPLDTALAAAEALGVTAAIARAKTQAAPSRET